PRRAPDPAAARRAVEEALEAQRGVVVARCIPPAARGGAPSRLRLDLTFDSNGRQIARGIIPARNDPRPELGPCATDALPALQLAAQYAPIALKVDWSLP
ncbi:MAG: hypothetical protein RL685_7145, partial [Pseudomonadota bacterium]